MSEKMRFEMNGRIYETDKETFDVLDSIIPPAKKGNDCSAVVEVMNLGLEHRGIKEAKHGNANDGYRYFARNYSCEFV